MPTDSFKNVRFGNRFLTRDGRKVIFLRFWGNPTQSAFLYIEGWGELEYTLDGMRADDTKPSDWDIVKPCRADGWEPLPTERERLEMELHSVRELLAAGREDLLMRTSFENRIKMLEEELKEQEDRALDNQVRPHPALPGRPKL